MRKWILLLSVVLYPVCGYSRTIAFRDGYNLTLDDYGYASVVSPEKRTNCRDSEQFRSFDADNISEIYIPKDIYRFMREDNYDLAPYIIHNGEKIILQGDIFKYCADRHIVAPNAYKELPDDCQFVVSRSDCVRYVCSKHGCKWFYAELIIDMENGEYYPVQF